MKKKHNDKVKRRALCAVLAFLLAACLPLGADAQQRWWGYYADGADPSYMGTQSAETYTCGAQFSSARTVLRGATVHAVRFFLRDKTNISDVKVWLSTTQPATAEAANIMVVDVPQEQLADLDHDQRMVEVTLPDTYSFGEGSVYVGYSFKMGSAKTGADKQPVVCAGKGNGGSGSFWIRTTKTLLSWNDMGARYGALALQLLVSNPSLKANAVEVGTLERMVGVAGSDMTTEVELTSAGLSEVRSIDYKVVVGAQQYPEQHYDLPAAVWTPGSSTTMSVSFKMPVATGLSSYSVEVTKVNGSANEAPQTVSSGQYVAVDRLARRRSVVEEYTGTWCVNCPRGIVGMSNLQQQFPDDFIGIAVHTNDPMALSAYEPLQPSGVPRCQIDRALWCDPYKGLQADNHYHLDDAFRLMLSRPSEADLQLEAAWTDEAQTQLQLTARPTFHFDSTVADDYALSFIITADGLTGNTKEWWQANAESGSNTFPDSDMDRFRNAPDPVRDIAYNHVPVAVQGLASGLSGSIGQPIVSGVPQAFTTTFDISRNGLIQDKSQLTAVVLLLDTATGQVVNAAKAHVGTGAGIRSVGTGALQSDWWFTPDGRRVDSPQRPGIYIKGNKKLLFNR